MPAPPVRVPSLAKGVALQMALHKNARTITSVHREIAESTEPIATCARRYGVSGPTMRKWRSHRLQPSTPYTLQATPASAQESIVVYLGRYLPLPLDDLPAVTREFLKPQGLLLRTRSLPVASRAVNLGTKLPATEKPRPGSFKDYIPRYLHIDVKYLSQLVDEPRRGHLSVAIDWAIRCGIALTLL